MAVWVIRIVGRINKVSKSEICELYILGWEAEICRDEISDAIQTLHILYHLTM